MRSLIFLISILMMLGIASASTVTLTGSCYSKIINQTNNYIQFNLSNSGNGTATNLILAPVIQGASTSNSSILIPIVAPGGSYSSKIYLSNFTIPGSYVERFVARYSQATSTFITIFPCLVNIGQSAPSLLGITTVGKRGGNIYVNISNIASYQIGSQVTVYAPPSFTFTPTTRNVTINQYSFSNISFGVSTPQYTNAVFPIVVALSYVRNNVHYATLAVTTITFGSGTNSLLSTIGQNLILWIVAVIIAIIIILIIASVLINKRRRPSASPPKGPIE